MIRFRNINSLILLKNIRSYSSKISNDLPLWNMEDPYKKEIKRCIICINDIPLDYKNIRLLSQFVSPYTGQMYDAHITGLCNNMQDKIKKLIGKARDAGLMANETKEMLFLNDPKISPGFKK